MVKSRVVLVWAIIATVVAAVSLAPLTAQANGGSNTIYAAYQKVNGMLRLIKSPDEARPSEEVISWNQVGPEGPAGPQGIQGEPGPQGPVGPIGPEGPQGSKGDTGAQGPQGIQGEIGPQGPAGPQGPQGEQGIHGPQGEIGLAGPQGEKGDKGDTGATGAQGPIGPTGATGATGPQGPQGVPGPQFSSVPVYVQVPESAFPVPAGLKFAHFTGPNSPADPMLHPYAHAVQFNGYTYIPFSYIDNRFAMNIVAYDANYNIVQQTYKPGARYCYAISVDAANKVITFKGQGDNSVTMTYTTPWLLAP